MALTLLHFRHQHKNTIQALAFSPYLDGSYLAAGSRDQSVSVFDIRAMKEFRMYKGHKREVCCEFSLLVVKNHGRLITACLSTCMAPRSPATRVGRVRRGPLVLGPLLTDKYQQRRSSLFPPLFKRHHSFRATRYPLPSTRLEHMVACLSSSGPPSRQRLERPHNTLLVERASGRQQQRV